MPQGNPDLTIGEVVGRSDMMMVEYHHLPEKTREVEWHDAEGRRYIRTGDLACFDEEGFLSIKGRAKDLIISGGFNVYPSDIENELMRHEAAGITTANSGPIGPADFSPA